MSTELLVRPPRLHQPPDDRRPSTPCRLAVCAACHSADVRALELVIALVSLIGGWHSLAKLYRREETTFTIGDDGPVEKYRSASLKLGPKYFPTNYGNCTTVSLSDRGVGLSVMPLFRGLTHRS